MASSGELPKDRSSGKSGSRRCLAGTSESIFSPDDVFVRQSSVSTFQEDEEALQWAALEKLPTLNRLRTAVLRYVGEDGKERTEEIDVRMMSLEDRQHVIERILRVTEGGNECFLRKLRGRLDRVGINLPKIEVRFHHLNVEAAVHLGSRATPSLPNFFKSFLEAPMIMLGLSKKVKVKILSDMYGIVKPSRLTLLLGPPESGKTSLLRALAGRLGNNLHVSGDITYNGHQFKEFFPRKTAAYISQHDLLTAELTVREDLYFYSRVQGVGNRYDILKELSKRERDAEIKPEPDVDIYLKATSVTGQSTNLFTDYMIKLMGLDICADTRIGDAMHRGISGGQKKRVTTAEILVGPARALFMDEISTGLDSSTTFQIVNMLQQIVHLMDNTVIVSLLQPPPETYALFDDIILLAEGQIVYQGPCSHVLDFFSSMGFQCPKRKATADFLQEVTSRKDQRQYWTDKSVPYEYVSVSRFVEGYKNFPVGQDLAKEMSVPYERSENHPAALVYEKYALSKLELFKACFAREVILMKRHLETYFAKALQIAIIALMASTLYLRTTLHHDAVTHGTVYLGALFFCLILIMTAGLAELAFTSARLPVYFKEKELCLYPAWALTVPIFILRIPWSMIEAGVYVCISYFITGFAPEAGRFFRFFFILLLVNQATIGVFRLAAGCARSSVTAMNIGSIVTVMTIVLGGFVLSEDNMPFWWKWASWISCLNYGQQAISLNEFLSKEWNKPFGNTTVGLATLRQHGLETRGYWVWINMAALTGFVVLYNILFTLSLQFLDPHPVVRSSATKLGQGAFNDEGDSLKGKTVPEKSSAISSRCSSDFSDLNTGEFGTRISIGDTVPTVMIENEEVSEQKTGMVLPFRPLSISFDKICYYVDMPEAMKDQGVTDGRLQLLRDVSGAFRPGVLTALMGVSGAGKTTLMDVLAGRKTRGNIEGEIRISGYLKKQSTFARIAGYCEQSDIHSPNITVYESLIYSAWMRLAPEIKKSTRLMFVEEVMTLVELDVMRDFVVGLPGVSGLSTEQRKRLTIAVELVANPSLIFMDEPTSGLDARAAAIVMRAIRNVGDTGRTVVCTIHQPSIDIFDSFDELLLLTRGGETIYSGPLGKDSSTLIEYFETIPGVPKIKEGHNPATWILDVSSICMESKLGIDFAEIYRNSTACVASKELVKRLAIPAPGSQDIQFPTVYAQTFSVQCMACLWKMGMAYWRNTAYTGARILFTLAMAFFFGSVFWGLGKKRDTEQDIFNLIGASYCSLLFLGANAALSVQPVVSIERIVYYRELGAGMYSPFTYAFAQFLVEWPQILLQSILFTSISYSMIQYEWTYSKFLWFFFILVFSMLFYTYWGMIAVAATPNAQIAAILVTSVFGFFNLFTGFTITRKQMPAWWAWFYWCVPTSWTMYGLIGSQLGDVESFISIVDRPDEKINVKQYVEGFLGYNHNFLKWVAVEQVILCFTMAVIFAFLIKHLNFQRR